MLEALKKNPSFTERRGPVVLMILDGVGYGKYKDGDAYLTSPTPMLDYLSKNCPITKLKAHGKAVGMPSDEDMGNSEVGHNAIGCGRVFAQGAKLVNDAVKSGVVFDGASWKNAVNKAKDNNGALHFLGLFSDGNVHSNINHLKKMIAKAKEDGIAKVFVHALLDGRDVPATSAFDYIDPFEEFLTSLNDGKFTARIASGGGRMVLTMDRYGADWNMVKVGWATHVKGEGRYFTDAHSAVQELRSENKGILDQDLPPFVISDDSTTPIGPIVDGDALIFFNFRGDRSQEISAAFDKDEFPYFDRGNRPDVFYAGMMEYDSDAKVPTNFLVSPPKINRTMGEFLCASGVKQLATSETQKFGHVTYFFNGNKSGKFSEEMETYVEVPSDIIPFEQRPWMKAAEITDEVIKGIKSGDYGFIRCNIANGDMVGHTGVYQAVTVAMGAVDICVARVKKAVEEAGGVLVVTADHGNCDDMYEHDKKGSIKHDSEGDICNKTSHSLNPVPCIIFDADYKKDYSNTLREGLGISSIAATCLELLGFEAPSDYDQSVLTFD